MTVYVDMDGVIADFFGGLAKYAEVDHWKSIQDKEKTISGLRGTDFFYTLDMFPTSERLIDFVKEVSDLDWGICSSPLRGDRDNSAYWKRVWLQEMGFMPSIDRLIFTGTKEKYAWSMLDGRPNILIDDKPENIKRWNDTGGIGILYQANENDLEEELFPEVIQALRVR